MLISFSTYKNKLAIILVIILYFTHEMVIMYILSFVVITVEDDSVERK